MLEVPRVPIELKIPYNMTLIKGKIFCISDGNSRNFSDIFKCMQNVVDNKEIYEAAAVSVVLLKLNVRAPKTHAF